MLISNEYIKFQINFTCLNQDNHKIKELKLFSILIRRAGGYRTGVR